MIIKKELGIIESVDNDNKVFNLLGYGTYLGEYDKSVDGLDDITVKTPKVRLENGKEVWVDEYNFFASRQRIEEMVAEYKNKGYTINMK